MSSTLVMMFRQCSVGFASRSINPSPRVFRCVSSPRRRAALVNRLLQERDIRLRTSGSSGAEKEGAEQVDDSRRFEYWGTIGSGQGRVNNGSRDTALKVDDDPSPGVDGSPESSGKIFFASDILDDINGADRRVEDVGSLSLRDLATGVLGHKIGAHDRSGSIPGEDGGGLAGEAGYLNVRDGAVQEVQHIKFSKPGESDLSSVDDLGDAPRTAAAGRCGPGDAYVSSWEERRHQNAEQDRYRGRVEAAAVQLEEHTTCEPNNNKRCSSPDGQQQSRGERRIEVRAKIARPGGVFLGLD